MSGPYDDIIQLPHPTSARHPRMSLSNRAAHFSPFAALSGHSAALAETARLTDQQIELSDDDKAVLDQKQRILLEHINEHPEIMVTWFQPDEKKDGGQYITTTGRLKRFDESACMLLLKDGSNIPISHIVPEEIAEYPLILPSRARVRAEILNWLKREEKDLHIPLSYTLLSNAVLLVEEGLGCAFCLDGALAIRSSPSLIFIPIRPERTTRSVLIWKKNHLFSPATSLFIREINILRQNME